MAETPTVLSTENKRLVPTIQGLSESEIDKRFEDFFNGVDTKTIEKIHNKPFTEYRKQLMKKSFIKNDGYPCPIDVWPEDYYLHKTGW